MANFESDSFGKKPVGNSTLREFNVMPDDQEDIARQQREFEERVKASREMKANPDKAPMNSGAKGRLEYLTSIGRATKDVVIEGHTFSLRTLKAKEAREATLQTFAPSSTQVEAAYEGIRQQLGRALYKIDGHDIAEVLSSDKLEAVFKFVDDMEESVQNKLFEEFQSLKNESNAKYSLKNDNDVKEVATDIKK